MAISYWRQRDRYYRFVGSKCKACGSEYFPPVYRCRQCGSGHLHDFGMPMTGRLLTYTVLHEPMAGFEDQVPLILGIVKLENKVKVVGQIVDSPPEEVHIGDKVKTVFRRVQVDGRSGQIYYGYKFAII